MSRGRFFDNIAVLNESLAPSLRIIQKNLASMSKTADLIRLHHEDAPIRCHNQKEQNDMKYMLMMTGTKADFDWYGGN